MCIKKTFFLLLFLTYSLLLNLKGFAGDRKGNGADFLSCPDRAYLLDFYEGNLTEFSWAGSDVELAQFLLKKILPFSPVRLNEYIELAAKFHEESRFVGESELGKISDAGGIKVPLPNDCQLVQGVIQKRIVFGNEKRYLINKKEWDRLSVIHRAGIIVHEIIYRELQSVDSHQIRDFNNWLFSTGLERIADRDFYEHLQSAGYEWVYLNGFPMDAQKLILNDGPVRSTSTIAGKPFSFFNQTLLSKKHMVDSYSNGFPKSIQYNGSLKFESDQYFFNACAGENHMNCKINLSSKGKVVLLNNVEVIEKSSGNHGFNKIIIFNELGGVDEIL